MTDENRPATAALEPPAEAADSRAPGAVGVRAAERLERKARTKKRIARREACFELLSAGYTHHEIARRLKVTLDTVRRDVDREIDRRRLAAPERYIHLQVDRLTRALCSMDQRVGDGDPRAVKPLINLIGALDRYHGLGPLQREARRLAPLPAPLAAPAPLALAPPAQQMWMTAESDTQDIEKIGS